MEIPELNAKLQACNFEAMFDETMMENQAQIIDTLTEHQLQLGLDSTGSKIGHYQNDAYARMKFQQNPRAGEGFIDLKLTGAFYEGMFMEQQDADFQIQSTDDKNEMLKVNYGEDIFGLTDENAGEVAQDYLLEGFLKSIRENLEL